MNEQMDIANVYFIRGSPSRGRHHLTLVILAKPLKTEGRSAPRGCRLTLSLAPMEGTSQPPVTLEAMGAARPGRPVVLTAETALVPGKYQLNLPGEKQHIGGVFVLPEAPGRAIQVLCPHDTPRPSSREVLADLAPSGDLRAVWVRFRFHACCASAVEDPTRRPAWRAYGLSLYVPPDQPVEYDTSRGRVRVRPGEYLLANPLEEINVRQPTRYPFIHCMVSLLQPLLREVRDAAGLPASLGGFGFVGGPKPLSPALTQGLANLEEGLSRPDALGRTAFVQSAAWQLLLTLIRTHPNALLSRWEAHVGTSQEDPRLTRALAYLEAHFADPMTVPHWARQAGLSQETLRRLFVKRFFQSPLDYLQAYRVAKAKILLRDPSHTVEEIARAVGYENVRHFYRLFYAHTQTPLRRAARL